MTEQADAKAEERYSKFDTKGKAVGAGSVNEANFAAIERLGGPQNSHIMTDDTNWSFELLSNLGLPGRPVLKAGPFGSSVVKSSYAASGHKLYGQQEVLARRVDATDYYVTREVFRRHLTCSVQPGDVLITTMGTVGRTFVVPEGAPAGIINPRLMRIAVDPSKIFPDFLEVYLSSSSVQKLLARRAHGGTMSGLNSSSIGSLRIPLPPLPEQRKITEILRTWDEAIERSANLIRAETEILGALRQQLFASVSHEVPLGEVSTRVTRKSDGGRYTVMAISAKSGFLAQADKYRRDMAGANVVNYTLLRRGEFAYNKGNSLTYPQGCIYALKAESALVPNVYYSFRLHSYLNSSYYEHFFASGALNRQLARRITSGVRGNGLLNLNADDFFDVRIPVPGRAAQDAGADALNARARRIELLKRKVELLRIQKRGLTQNLLTGRLRVNVAAEIEPGGLDD